MAANEIVHRYFLESLRKDTTDEGEAARNYAYGRWSEEFCSFSGIGYAPSNGKALFEYCRNAGISVDVLFETGIAKKGDSGIIYPFFRQRIMIPIRNRWGRIIGFTGRYIGDNPKTAKYLNSQNSIVYDKGASLFGLERASRQKSSDIIIVEGAPDVLRLQSIGLENVVATLGTSWSESQFKEIRKITTALCFIPDSDVVEGKLFGPGFEAVMKNGAAALKKGFEVTVRELPFAEVPVTYEDIKDLYPDPNKVPKDFVKIKPGKNDPDSYIKSKEDYTALTEKYFVVWLAEKRFFESEITAIIPSATRRKTR